MHASPRAKINLTLSVGPRGADGYHPVESQILRIGLADDLTVAFADRGADTLTVTGLPGCPVEGNLVLRAFAAVRRAVDQDLPPLAAHLDKRIPMAAGLGGGSSDAAAAIEAAEVMWGVGLAPQVRREIEVGLGADVPFFAAGGESALVTGRGEEITRVPPPSGVAAVLLVTPPFALSTAQVFARFDELAPSVEPRRPEPNDLWPAAVSLAPNLAAMREFLEAHTGNEWVMTGSGSTLFALYSSPEDAAEAGRRLVSAESEVLIGAIINAVDLAGPEPQWRYP